MIQLNKHKVYPESIANVQQVLESGWTGLGNVVSEFEDAVKQYLGTNHVIAFNSGTAALQAALYFVPNTYGAYIITTPNTFVSTNHCIVQAFFQPVFADIEPDTGNISMESVLKLLKDPFIRKRTRAIMAVHYAGQPVDMDTLYDIGTEYHLEIIEDAAHAFGAEYNGDKIGCKYSRLVAFSLHSVKPLAVGDGGLLATYDGHVDSFARKLRWCGINKSTSDRTSGNSYNWDYNVELTGHKSHMNNIHAAIGLGQLIHYEEDAAYRQMLVDTYRDLLKDCPEVLPLTLKDNRKSSNHLFVIRCLDVDDKSKLMAYLGDCSIQTSCHYRPSHMYAIYNSYESDDGCPNAVDFFNRVITLPLHLEMTKEDVMYVVDKIKEYFKRK